MFKGFEHGGTHVVNPTVSDCGRFTVSPAEYGFSQTLTEEGSAWQRIGKDATIYLHRNHSHRLGPDGTEFTLVEYTPRISLPSSYTLRVGFMPEERSPFRFQHDAELGYAARVSVIEGIEVELRLVPGPGILVCTLLIDGQATDSGAQTFLGPHDVEAILDASHEGA